MSQPSPPGLVSVTSVLPAYRRIGWLFTLAWGAFVVFRRLLREGMWADGLTYASIARNMAIGKGSFWSPVFASSFWLPYNPTETFYEHPPLQFYLQSWFFRLLGDTYVTERVYCFVVIALIIVLLVQLWWQLIPVRHPLHRWEWLPVLLLFTCPLTEWTYQQNYLDATMSLFCLLAVKYTIEGWQNPKKWLVSGVIATAALLAAFLTKGPVSLHVLAVPALYGFCYFRPIEWKPALRWTLLLTGGFGVFLALLLLHEPARIFLQNYFHQQVWAALNNKREVISHTTGFLGRTYIVKVLLINAAPALVLMALLWVINRFGLKTKAPVTSLGGMSRFYMGLALAATLPMMATTKQFDYYAVPALPYLALGLGAWLGPSLFQLISSLTLSSGTLRLGTVLGALACLTTALYGLRIAGTPYHRYEPILSDVAKIGAVVPPDSQVGVCPDMIADALLQCYIQRYHRLEMTTLTRQPAYFLANSVCRDTQHQQLARAGYRPVPVSLKSYILYHRPAPSGLTNRL